MLALLLIGSAGSAVGLYGFFGGTVVFTEAVGPLAEVVLAVVAAGAVLAGAVATGSDASPSPVSSTISCALLTPAKVVGEAGCPEPSRAMDQMLYGVMLDG